MIKFRGIESNLTDDVGSCSVNGAGLRKKRNKYCAYERSNVALVVGMGKLCFGLPDFLGEQLVGQTLGALFEGVLASALFDFRAPPRSAVAREQVRIGLV
jgi:hypothetical protein